MQLHPEVLGTIVLPVPEVAIPEVAAILLLPVAPALLLEVLAEATPDPVEAVAEAEAAVADGAEDNLKPNFC